jgi:hypothetical protein
MNFNWRNLTSSLGRNVKVFQPLVQITDAVNAHVPSAPYGLVVGSISSESQSNRCPRAMFTAKNRGCSRPGHDFKPSMDPLKP